MLGPVVHAWDQARDTYNEERRDANDTRGDTYNTVHDGYNGARRKAVSEKGRTWREARAALP